MTTDKNGFKSKDIKAEKTSDTARLTLAFFETMDEAKHWIGSAHAFRITDGHTGAVLEAREIERIERFDRASTEITAPALVAVTGGNTHYGLSQSA